MTVAQICWSSKKCQKTYQNPKKSAKVYVRNFLDKKKYSFFKARVVALRHRMTPYIVEGVGVGVVVAVL